MAKAAVQDPPAAQTDDQRPDPAAASQDPAAQNGDGSPASPAAESDEQKARRIQLAEEGRQRVNAERQEREQLRETVANLQRELEATKALAVNVNETLTQQKQAEIQAWLESLPPDEREKQELRLQLRALSTEVESLKETRQERRAEETQAEYGERRIREILAMTNKDLGLAGTPYAIQRNTPDLDFRSEGLFMASAADIARARRNMMVTDQGNGQQQRQEIDVSANNGNQVDEDAVYERVLRRLGAGAGISGNPSQGIATGLEDEELVKNKMKNLQFKMKPTKGMAAQGRAMVAERERIAGAMED